MRLLVTGGEGMLGSAIVAQWRLQHPDDEVRILSRSHVDLRDREATHDAIREVRPDAIIHAAAKVGGAGDKVEHPLGYLLDNVQLDANVITAALATDVPELLYVASAAVYPAAYERPFVESDLFGGPLESVNEGYAIAKLAGLRACEYASREHGVAYRSVLPSNLYGLNDHFDLASGHLIPAAIRKVHEARESGASEVVVWGDGTARREFTFAGDVAGWLVGQVGSLAEWPSTLNLGCGVDHSVREYYEVARDIVGFSGELSFDVTKPSGVPQRLLDSSAARTRGFVATTALRDGMAAAYEDYLSRLPS